MRESYETYERSKSVKSARKNKDKLHKACERASETHERTLCRQEQNRVCMASMRESETFEQTILRQEQNRMRTVISSS